MSFVGYRPPSTITDIHRENRNMGPREYPWIQSVFKGRVWIPEFRHQVRYTVGNNTQISLAPKFGF